MRNKDFKIFVSREVLENFDDYLYENRHNNKFSKKYDIDYFTLQQFRCIVNDYINNLDKQKD